MTKRTDKYQLGYFEQDDFTSPRIELQRWEALDAQLNALFTIIGNGIEDGWDLVATSGLNITVAPGSGHVAFVAVESLDSFTISNLLPNSRSYIYAEIQENSYWTKNVNFAAYTTFHNTDDESLYLGFVDTSENAITLINIGGRQFLGFQNIINEAVADHRHIGGTGNPSPINLSTEVQGLISQNNLPDLDTSIMRTGDIDPDRLPKIDHIKGLTDQGTLTHAQLDAFVETLNIADNKLMGEVSTINLLQLILALKHWLPDVDEFLVNEIALIPGISPDDYIDDVNTTADVDTRPAIEGGQHTISMSPTAGLTAYTRTWDTEDDFEGGDNSNVFIDGDSVCLATTSNELALEEFEDIDSWTVITEDLSSAPSSLTLDGTDFIVGTSSGKLSITSQETEMSLVIRRDFNAQDWSSYNFLTFYLKTEDVEHGDWLFFLNDAISGVQNSFFLALERNTPTINVDTLLNGWQEITIDISSFTRTAINQIGFFTSTQAGWDTSKPFDLNIDNIFLSTGNTYEDDGYSRVTFGSELFVNFWRLRWDAVIPTDSASLGIIFKARTRVANTELGLSTASWSDYSSVSGEDIDLPTESLFKFIEIESFFGTSTENSRTACLKKLYLDFNVSDENAQFEFDSQDDWETGNLFNIDTTTDPGSIQIADVDDIGTYYFATDGSAGQLDDNLGVNFSVLGSVLPITTYQAMNDLTPKFGYLSGVARGNAGSLWMTDTDNDRVVNVDKYGNLIAGFYGSFLTVPEDPYGTEDSGPGSNTDVQTATTEETTEKTEIDVLHSLYNPNEGVLYIVFNSSLENIYDAGTNFNINKIYLKLNAHKFILNDSKAELLGLPKDKYDLWNAVASVSSDATTFISHFNFDSHVLKLTLQGADKTFLNNLVDEEVPAIGVGSPYQNFRTTESSIDVNFTLRGCILGTAEGECGIEVTVDGGTPTTIYTDTFSVTGLTEGAHEVEAQLLDSSLSALTNDESFVSVQFTQFATYTDPYLKVFYPRPNQTYSNNPVIVEFESENFPVVPSGQHIKYQIDTDSPVDYYSTEPISLIDLDPGIHLLKIWTVDLNGDQISFDYGTVMVDFIVGLNPNAVLKLYMDRGAIYDKAGTAPVITSRTSTDVGNVYFRNIYSPIDLQLIPNDTSGLSGGGLSMMVGKLRSKSWLDELGDEDRATEIAVRAENIARSASGTELLAVNNSLANISTELLIFDSKYLNGHSVVQLNEVGDTVFSNNAARFAEDKERAKVILGSVEKIGASELLIGDSVNQRAIITFTDLSTQTPTIEWQFDSDRLIPDFHIVPQEQKVIDIFDDSISENNIFVRQGVTIVWRNSSSSPVTIYSGTTTADLFAQDPDLTLYGDIFISPVLDPGETFVFEFIDDGEFDWFVYPDILTGKINVTRQRLSSRDLYYILESDGLESPFTSRLIKVDSWGNILWSFGEGYLVKPRDVRPLLDGNILLST